MKKFNDYETTQAYTNAERLPIGGYVIKIENVKLEEGTNGMSDRIALMFDIADGEFKGFFRKNYENQTQEDKKWKGTYRIYCPKDDGSEQDVWTKRRFKTIMEAFEDSNPGFVWNWDEKLLKGKTIGAIFNDKEYEFNGNHGFFTNCYALTKAEDIKKGNFKIPEPTLLKQKNSAAVPSGDFVSIPDGVNEEIPF